MASGGTRRKRRIAVVACPDHRGGHVVGNGRRLIGTQWFQRYRCRSASKSAGTHYFLIPIDGEERVAIRPAWTAPPRCAKHPGTQVIRFGPYGEDKAGRPRQRYRCRPECRRHERASCPAGCSKPAACGKHPEGCDASGYTHRIRHCAEHLAVCPKDCPDREHTFTPPLARRWIAGHGFSDACEHCEQPRGVHAGEPNAARHHSFTSLIVAEGLIRLSGGDTYSETSQTALAARRGKRSRRSTGNAAKRPASRARAADSWHIAADWVECWAPTFWDPLDAALRARASEARARIDADLAAGRPLVDPIVWVADEMIIGQKGGTQAFVVLVVAEADWTTPTGEPTVRLRLARAVPDKGQTSWLLAWDELSGPGRVWPDFLVSDNGAALLTAARSVMGSGVRWVPSLWHLSRSVRAAYWGRSDESEADIPGVPQAIEFHIGSGLRRGSDAMSSVAAWWAWWDRLADLFAVHGRSPDILIGRREAWGEPFALAIPDLAGTWTPLSNAAIESIQRTRLRRIFASRDHAMTSIERTNALLDLVVAREHGLLNSSAEVARRLREDAHAHGGWTSPARSINDPANPNNPRDRYKSLRDRTLTQRLVFERKLA